MSSAVIQIYDVSDERPDKKTAKEYRRDAQHLFWASQKWAVASLKFGEDKVGWEREVVGLTKLKRDFTTRWGLGCLEEELRRIYIRLATIKLAEPVPVYVPREAMEQKREVAPEERRRQRRVSKYQLRRRFRLCY